MVVQSAHHGGFDLPNLLTQPNFAVAKAGLVKYTDTVKGSLWLSCWQQTYNYLGFLRNISKNSPFSLKVNRNSITVGEKKSTSSDHPQEPELLHCRHQLSLTIEGSPNYNM
jgi:hypothetical protein